MDPVQLAIVLPLAVAAAVGAVVGGRRLLERARDGSRRDPTTRVATRERALEHLERCLARARRFDRTVAVLIVGPDRLDRIDDRLGHRATAAVLAQVARRLEAAVRDNDLVGRWDERRFVVVVDEVGSVVDSIRVAERIIAFNREPVPLRRGRAGATVSVGVAVSPSGGHELEELTAQAVTAFERASGRSPRSQRSPNAARASADLRLEADLRSALAQDRFVLHYQPIVDLTNLRITGAEALLRWDHPDRGLIGAGEFIEVAERSGLVVPIGRWVLQEASRAAHRLSQIQAAPFPVSVNLSPGQLADPGLLGDITAAVGAAGIDGRHLHIELTEGALSEHPGRAVDVLSSLWDAGHRVSIDDFGTGLVSVAHLRRLPLSSLKIDASFVDGMRGVGDAVIGAILGLADGLRLDVTAEGVTHEAQHARLRELGCTHGQGHLFGAPLTENDLTATLLHGGVAGPVVRLLSNGHGAPTPGLGSGPVPAPRVEAPPRDREQAGS